MSYSNDMSKLMQEGKEYLVEEGHKTLKEGKKQIEEGGKDWWAYVENHPLQTLVFGAIGYLALKGFLKK